MFTFDQSNQEPWVLKTEQGDLLFNQLGVFVLRGVHRQGPMPVKDALQAVGLKKFQPCNNVVDLLRKHNPLEVPSVVYHKKLTRPRPRKPSLVGPQVLSLFRASKTKPTVGFDITARAHEVRKLLFKLFQYHISRGGFDPEEVVQEVMLALTIRNQGKCPFDATKSSFGHYVYIVISGTLANMARKSKRKSKEISEGLTGRDDEEISRIDKKVADDYRVGGEEDFNLLCEKFIKDETDSKLITLITESVSLGMISEQLGISRKEIQTRLNRYRSMV